LPKKVNKNTVHDSCDERWNFQSSVDEESDVVVLKEDMHNPILNSMLINLGWKDDESKPVAIKAEALRKLLVGLHIKYIYLHLICLQAFLLQHQEIREQY